MTERQRKTWGEELYSQIQHGARRTSWDCWSPLTPASLTPSTSWTRPSRVGPQPCAASCPLDSCALLEGHAPLLVSLLAAAILQKVGRPNLQLQMVRGKKRSALRGPMFSKPGKNVWPEGSLTAVISAQDIFHWQIMDGNLTGNIREFLPIVGERVPLSAPSSSAVLLLSSHPSRPPVSVPQASAGAWAHICYICPQGMCRWHRSQAGGTLAALES